MTRMDQIEVELEKLTPESGDLVVVRLAHEIDAEALGLLYDRLQKLMPAGVKCVFASPDVTIELIKAEVR